MSKCIFENDCNNLPLVRGVCKAHYQKLRNSGQLDSVALPTTIPAATQHTLTNKDPASGTATCAICGPNAPMVFKPSRKGWRCGFRVSQWRQTYKFSGDKRVPTTDATQARTQFMESQNGLCAICKEAPATHLDHCHTTGNLRGLLCMKCNTGLGMFGDDLEKLKTAIDYLSQ
jgi:hypothetical protein